MSDDPRFDQALKFLLLHEGGYVDDPHDPGGATNFGVSLRWLRDVGHLDLDGDGLPDGDIDLDGDVDVDDIRAMSREDAARLYRLHWWDRYDYGSLHLTIGTKVFDLAVNMGARQAHRVVQRACRACGESIADDGLLGPVTRAAIAGIAPQTLLLPLRSEAAGFYRSLIAARPALSRYRDGWLNRAYA